MEKPNTLPHVDAGGLAQVNREALREFEDRVLSTIANSPRQAGLILSRLREWIQKIEDVKPWPQ